MTTTADLLGRFPAPSVPVSTSEDAADSLTPTLGKVRRQVLLYFASRTALGATTDEVEAALDGRHQTISPRVKELRDLGLIQESTEVSHDGGDYQIVGTRKRKTRSGRAAIVYEITEKGRKVARGDR